MPIVEIMEMNFCRRCGTSLINIERHVFRCKNQHIIYANSSPTAGIWLVNEHNEVLVATRGIEPHRGDFDTIGGFVDENESLEEAIHRELQEELGIKEPIELHYLTSGHDIYPYKNELVPLLNVIFWARISSDLSYTPSDDVAEAQFMAITAVSPERIHHNTIRRSLVILDEILKSNSTL